MSFLNSIFLFGLTLGLLPIIIHLLNRQKKKRLEFSTLRYLSELHRKKAKKLQLKKWLLLLIRTLLVLMLVLAFSRPLLRNNQFQLGHSAQSYILLMDNSASMNTLTPEGSRWELGKRIASAICEKIGEGNQFRYYWIDPLSGEVEWRQSGTVMNAQRIVEQIEISELEYDWGKIFRALNRTCDDLIHPLAGVLIISDGQNRGWDSTAFFQFKQKFSNINFQLIQPGEKEPYNLSVDSVYFSNPQMVVGSQIELMVRIRNHSSSSADNAGLDLYLDNQRIEQKLINLESNGKSLASFNFSLKNGGNHHGQVVLQDDDFINDNAYYFNFIIPDTIRLLCISDTSANPFPLLAAINPIDTASVFRVDTFNLQNLPNLNFNRYQGIILNQLSAFPYYLMSNLRQFINQGGAIFFLPGLQSDISALNRAYFDFFQLPLQFHSLTTTEANEYFSFKSELVVGKNLALNDPLYWKNAKLYRYFQLFISQQQPFRFFLYTQNQTPLAVSTQLQGEGNMVIFAFPFEENATNLMFQPIFVPFIQTLVTQTILQGAKGSESNEFFTGDRLTQWIKKQGINQNTKIGYLNGTEEKIQDWNLPLSKAGNYRLYSADHNDQLISANLNRLESESGLMIDTKACGIELMELTSLSRLQNMLDQLWQGNELSYMLLWIAMLLFIIESILARE